MTRIFISYDRATTRQLAAQLRRIYGHDQVWYDEDIHGGEDWWAEIQERIAAADIFLFLLSPHSVQSEYCERERLAAAARSKKVLPVRIGSVDPLPAHFRSIQYVDVNLPSAVSAPAPPRNWRLWLGGVAAFSRIIGQPYFEDEI